METQQYELPDRSEAKSLIYSGDYNPFSRTNSTERDWLGSYRLASSLMHMLNNYDISFNDIGEKGSIRTRIPMGGIASYLNPININVSPDIAFAATSRNFRTIALAHELGEIRLSNNPAYAFVHFSAFPFFISKSLRHRYDCWRDRIVNRSVYKNIVKLSDDEQARKMMYRFVEELLLLWGQDPSGATNYITIAMPFLINPENPNKS